MSTKPMIQPARRIFRAAVCGIWILAATSCSERGTGSQRQQAPTHELLPGPETIETREDGLAWLGESTAPYTGLVLDTGSGGRPVYLAHYEDGELHGPEIRWHKNKRIKRIHDYQRGKKIRHREWFDTGMPKIDAMMRDGVAYGRHLRWHSNGQLRFDGNFIENLVWDGHVRDLDEDGRVIVDAEFHEGRYVSGTVPPEFPTGAKNPNP